MSGQVVLGKYQVETVTHEEEKQGYPMFCCAKPQSNLTIEVHDLEVDGFVSKKLPVRITKIEKLSYDVVLVCLQLLVTEKIKFRAGQYVDFLLRDGKWRSYSIANAMHTSDQINLHIRYVPGSVFIDQLFTSIKERDILRIAGPQGTFFLREDSDKPIILLASGTGFAPIKAIIEYALRQEIDRPITLYWGGRRPADLYMHQLCLNWAKNTSGFSYVPVVSDALPKDNWTGRTGFVHSAVLNDLEDLSGVQVYACGAPVMVDAARRDFLSLAELPAKEFYSDVFVFRG